MPTVSSPRLLASLAVVAVCVLSLFAISPQPAPADDMPYNATNQFIWDNDSESDAFALDFVMALAHAGSLKLIGISESPHPWKSTSENYQAIVEKGAPKRMAQHPRRELGSGQLLYDCPIAPLRWEY